MTTHNEAVRTARSGPVGIIAITHPPVNALSHAVRQGIVDAIRQYAEDAAVEAIVLVGDGATFPAGSDITEFGRPIIPPALNAVIEVVEGSPKPVIAAIHGTAFGGGLELAMGCGFRVASPGTLLGLPEVKLGLMPGGGGTQRLPRLIGIKRAVEAATSGTPLAADEARVLGLVDDLVEGDLVAGAVAFAGGVIAERRKPLLVRDRPLAVSPAEADLVDTFVASMESRWRGLFAPYRIVESIRNATLLPFAEGLKQERVGVAACLASTQHKALIHGFFAERTARKIPGPSEAPPARRVNTVGILGAGMLGTGLAMAFADHGFSVTLADPSQAALAGALDGIRRAYGKAAAKGNFSESEAQARVARIRGVDAPSGLADADLLIEAAADDLGAKSDAMRVLDRWGRADALLATSTAGLDVDAIGAGTSRPAQVVGMHFFLPPQSANLVEIVRGAATADDALTTAAAVVKALGKASVVVRNGPDFVGDRMLGVLFDAAAGLAEEGVPPQVVDRALREFGMAGGPFAMSDFLGLAVTRRLGDARRDRPRRTDLLERMIEQGRLGREAGRGWYLYEAGHGPVPDPAVAQLVEDAARATIGLPRRIDDAGIVARCLYPVVNEGVRLLAEGIAARSSDIDVLWVNGCGFPRYRGGPMFWADTVGLAGIAEALVRQAGEIGDGRLAPAPLLAELAGGTLGLADLAGGRARAPS